MKILSVAGARPNFMKIAAIADVFKSDRNIDHYLVHTGQHYDQKMSDLFFMQLGIPKPDINLEVGSCSHAVQTAEIMKSFEKVLLAQKPDAVLVVGDVNSTIACGLVASKMGIKLIHVEAGLRSFDRTMPEEINRVLTDCISDMLFCTEPAGVTNLVREGIDKAKIHLVGNVMIDTLLKHKQLAKKSDILDKVGVNENSYAVLTLHRPSNVDSPDTIIGLFGAIEAIQKDMPIVFPVHPRTANILSRLIAEKKIKSLPNLKCAEPLGYLEFMKLIMSARLVLTDSGGIQEETTVLQVPCLTLRHNTERPVTVDIGTNMLVGTDPANILNGYKQVMSGSCKKGTIPELWDGKAAGRIKKLILEDSVA